MRKITEQAINAFISGRSFRSSNTETDGKSLWLHGNLIAKKENGSLYITNAGWSSNTTKERLNSLPNVRINQKDFEWFLNGQKWQGDWINPETMEKLTV